MMDPNVKALQVVGDVWDDKVLTAPGARSIITQANEVMPVVFRRSALSFIVVRLRSYAEYMASQRDDREIPWVEEDFEFFRGEIEQTNKLIQELEQYEI